MENFICVQCGTQFGETAELPSRCPICEDERQFVRHTGQEWTTLKRLAQPGIPVMNAGCLLTRNIATTSKGDEHELGPG